MSLLIEELIEDITQAIDLDYLDKVERTNWARNFIRECVHEKLQRQNKCDTCEKHICSRCI